MTSGAADPVSPEDLAAVSAQLGRPVRGVVAVAHRCACGLPDVVKTAPRLPDGTPFPTLYYLTCPRATSAIGTLEADGVMRDMSEQLLEDAELAKAYVQAHEQYIAQREEIETVSEISGISAGGMPDRVKCLHVLVGHSLAAGDGVNPLGDDALEMLERMLGSLDCWGGAGRCVDIHDEEEG